MSCNIPKQKISIFAHFFLPLHAVQPLLPRSGAAAIMFSHDQGAGAVGRQDGSHELLNVMSQDEFGDKTLQPTGFKQRETCIGETDLTSIIPSFTGLFFNTYLAIDIACVIHGLHFLQVGRLFQSLSIRPSHRTNSDIVDSPACQPSFLAARPFKVYRHCSYLAGSSATGRRTVRTINAP